MSLDLPRDAAATALAVMPNAAGLMQAELRNGREITRISQEYQRGLEERQKLLENAGRETLQLRERLIAVEREQLEVQRLIAATESAYLDQLAQMNNHLEQSNTLRSHEISKLQKQQSDWKTSLQSWQAAQSHANEELRRAREAQQVVYR